MDIKALRRYAVPPGPILSLTLIGILLLGGVIYYRAVKIQRFLEPALAVSQPRIQFSETLNLLIRKEFGESSSQEVWFTANSILVNKALLEDQLSSSITIKKLGRIFSSLLRDEKMRQYIGLIVINSRPDNRQDMINMQHRSEGILFELFKSEPSLESEYKSYFAATSILSDTSDTKWVEFRIMGSEQLHVDVLLRLEKYIR